ncbi:MAG: DUF1576 domain-containing protein [Pseudothermotoga sp.]
MPSESLRWFFLYSFGLFFILFGLLTGGLWHPIELLKNLLEIVLVPDYLLTDYIEIGGISATFVNSGLLMVIFSWILQLLKLPVTGLSFACVLTVGGFALFGKNIFNVWPILIGVFLYSKYKREPFARYVYVSYFGTAIAPLVTQLAFFLPVSGLRQVALSYLIAIVIGFFLTDLAAHFLTTHKGYSLYNVGFTCGMIGMVAAAFMRAYGYEIPSRKVWSSGNNLVLFIFVFLMFFFLTFYGWKMNDKSFKNYGKLMKHSGKLVSDFILLESFPLTLINMGILGFLMTSYVLVTGSQLNGPTIGGIMTVVGFAAFGKHPKNVIPILIGVTISALTNKYSLSEPNNVLAALFGTTLAPIAGEFGPIWGVIAGFVHTAVVNNVGFLHGGLNLYNNGFAGGLVAMFLVPLIRVFHKGVE